MLSGKVWPIHPHSYRDELLSSWLVRSAHANGSKVQTFCHLAFKGRSEIWNRDIDRLAPDWLVLAMAHHTGIRPYLTHKTTLRKYKGILFDKERTSSILKWVNPLQVYHRIRHGYGLQYCPLCLNEGEEAYFRTVWRLALSTFCAKHRTMLKDRCFQCQAPIAFHRAELGKPKEFKPKPINACWNCGANLGVAPTQTIHLAKDPSIRLWCATLRQLGNTYSVIKLPYSCSWMSVLRHLCLLVTNTKLAPELQAYLCDRMCIPELAFKQEGLIFEQRSIQERHQALQLAWWVLGEWPHRLYEAWHYKTVRYNVLMKDLDNVPATYQTFVNKLNLRAEKYE